MSAPTEAVPAAKAKRTAKSEAVVLKYQHPPVEVDGSIFQPWPCLTEDLVAGRAWIGKAVRLDIQVETPRSKGPLDTWATILICAKSFMPIGWFIHPFPPSMDSLSMAIQHGVERCGKPDHILIDLGRKPHPGDLQHAESLEKFLGTQIEFKVAYTMISKVVEREFLKYRHDIARAWTANQKGKTFERNTQNPRIDAFQHFAGHVIGGLRPHRLLEHGPNIGESRVDAFLKDLKKHGQLPAMNDIKSAMICSTRGRSKIDSKGADGWWADWMADHQGETVIVSYDNFDMRIARVYEDAEVGCGKFIGLAEKIHGVAWRTEK